MARSLHAAPDLRAVFESAPSSDVVVDPDLTIVAVTDRYLRATGMAREDIIGHSLLDVFAAAPDARAADDLRASLTRVFERGSAETIVLPACDRRPDQAESGRRAWRCTNVPVIGADGAVAWVIHRIGDPTDPGSADRVDETERFRQIVENIDEVLYMADRGMRTMFYISPAYERVWGRTRRSLYAAPRSWLDALHPDDRDRVCDAVLASMAVTESFDHEYRIVRADGAVRWISDRGFPVRNESGEADRYVGIVKDITDLRKAEEDLRRSEEQLNQAMRMEAVGRLAGGVAHDFNNLMTAVAGYTALILQRLAESDPLRKEIEEIKKAGDRATALTRQLLAFGRKQVLRPRVLNLNPIVADMENMLRRLIGEHIDLTFRPGGDLGTVNADPGQLEQVVVNLVINARDAMAAGGHLTLETSNVGLNAEYANRHVDVAPGRYVMLAVTDTGVGMTPDILAQLFEPFFTTKDDGVGAGFGLSTVYGIVKQSGGHIDVYSEVGRGTTFKVYLPRVDEPADAITPPARPAQHSTRGTETILLVEDDDLVRNVTRAMLAAFGYFVLEAKTADQALSLSERHAGPVHLVLTDIVMPRMDGKQLVGRISHRRPGVRVMYMSGYTENAILHQGEIDPGTSFLQKPFGPEELAAKLRKALDAP